MVSGQFASEYDRDKDGLIQFPRDADYRKRLFPSLDLSAHPAKANIYLVQAIVEYVSEPDETIMDIMSGTGTILTAALIGRRVLCIEIEEEYQSIIEEGIASIERIAPGAEDMITLIPGDCVLVLPLPANHIIFSPPYTNIMRKTKLDKLSSEMMGEGLLTYSKDPANVGNLSEFMYHQKMERIYKKCYESLSVGGTMSIIIKDHIEAGERVYLGKRARDDCVSIGFKEIGWFKWKPPGSAYVGFMRARGDTVVEDEDIVVMEK